MSHKRTVEYGGKNILKFFSHPESHAKYPWKEKLVTQIEIYCLYDGKSENANALKEKRTVCGITQPTEICLLCFWGDLSKFSQISNFCGHFVANFFTFYKILSSISALVNIPSL